MTERFEQYGIYGIKLSGQKEQRAVCPECQKRKGSNIKEKDLAVNIDKSTWQCFSANCGWTGSLKKERKFDRPTFKPIKVTSKPLRENVYTWFQKRGITKEVIDRNQIKESLIFIPLSVEEIEAKINEFKTKKKIGRAHV